MIERAFNARCWDHAGATEVGAYAYSCAAQLGLHVNEAEFIAEIVDPLTLQPVEDGQRGELVLTNLGRPGWPVIRYRTGDSRGVGRPPLSMRPVHSSCCPAACWDASTT